MNVPAKSDKKFYQSRTVLINVLLFIVLAVPILFNLPQLRSYGVYAGTLVALLNLLVRFLGDNPVEIPDPSITVDRRPEGVKEGPIV